MKRLLSFIVLLVSVVGVMPAQATPDIFRCKSITAGLSIPHKMTVGTGTVNGLGMVDMARLSQLVYENSEVCFHAIVCDDDQLCLLTVCIRAKDLLGLIVDAGVTPRSKGGGKETEMSSADPAMPTLKPNPTTGKVTVVGVTGDVVEVVVMDMNGRRLAVFTDTDVFDIHSMSTGSYIVRIRTENGDVTYLKLIKQ